MRFVSRRRIARIAATGVSVLGLVVAATVVAPAALAAVTVIRVQQVSGSAAAADKYIEADCPSGTVATGTEVYVTVPPGATGRPSVNIYASSAMNVPGDSWGVAGAVTTTPASRTMPWILNLFLTCVFGYTNAQLVTSDAVATGSSTTATVTCPAGKVLVGVGYQASPPRALRVQSIGTFGGVTAQLLANRSPDWPTGVWIAYLNATCANGPTPRKVNGTSVTNSSSKKTGIVACGSQQAISGGFEVVNGDGAATMVNEYRLGNEFRVSVYNHGPLSHPSTLRPWAFCA